MAKKKTKSNKSLPSIGEQILIALTREEIVHLLDALFEEASPDARD